MQTIKHAPYLLLHAIQREYAGVIICVGLSILLSFKTLPFKNEVLTIYTSLSAVFLVVLFLKEALLYQRVADDIRARIEDFLGVNPESITVSTDEDYVNRHIASCLYEANGDAKRLQKANQDILLEAYNEISLFSRTNVSDTATQIAFALLLGFIIMQLVMFVA